MNLTCYNSSDRVAVNATLLFDDNYNDENLWSRLNLSVPLSSCSSPHPPDSPCMVCQFKQVVFAVCRNLTDGVRMIMEAAGQQVTISESDCPKPPSDDGPKPPSDETHMRQHYAFLILAAVILIIIIGVCVWKCWKHSRPENEQRGSDQPSHLPADTSVQALMQNGGNDRL